MKIVFLEQAWADYGYWQATDRQMLKRLNNLVRDCLRSPYTGIGKPEALKGELSGWWSRRIDDEHRLVYRVIEEGIEIAQCRFHYSKR